MVRASILAAFALLSFASVTHAQKYDMSAYFPLQPGLKWKYVDTSSNESFTLTVADKGSAHGSTTYKVKHSNGTDFDEVSVDNQGVRLHARAGRGLTTAFDPAVIFAGAQVEVGNTFSATPNYRNPATGNTMTWLARVAGVEDVTTPAGKFTGCLKIEIFVKDSKLGTKFSQLTMHLAKNVGVVKRAGQFFGTYFVHEMTGR